MRMVVEKDSRRGEWRVESGKLKLVFLCIVQKTKKLKKCHLTRIFAYVIM